jgi:hypothetical protein
MFPAYSPKAAEIVSQFRFVGCSEETWTAMAAAMCKVKLPVRAWCCDGFELSLLFVASVQDDATCNRSEVIQTTEASTLTYVVVRQGRTRTAAITLHFEL